MKDWPKPLRDWQLRAVEGFRTHDADDYLVMATPAAGKTTLALYVAWALLEKRAIHRVVIVCPTDHLRTQWTKSAGAVGIDLDPELHAGRCIEASDYVGAVVTYQQVYSRPSGHALAAGRRRTLVVFDELHHAADGKEWGTGLREAFGLASFRLALSGTPFRSDDHPIPFIRYMGGISQSDFTYGYSEALRDQVCRPIYFQTYDGRLQWEHEGRSRRATFDNTLTDVASRHRLKTALLTEAWLEQVLLDANDRLTAIRSSGHPKAGGLVIAMNQEHARDLAGQLERLCGGRVPVAISDDAASSETIAQFAGSADRWIVAVRMVSEGVDIPRLRVGVYATNVTTEMYFRQAVGRFVRMQPGIAGRQEAYLYLPKDPQLVEYAEAIEAERNHAIDKMPIPKKEDGFGGFGYRPPSSFVPLSAEARADRFFGVDLAAPGSDTSLYTRHEGNTVTLVEQKDMLKERHRELVNAVAKKTGTGHREINLELIKRVGGKIEFATVKQLERRIRLLNSWHERGFVYGL